MSTEHDSRADAPVPDGIRHPEPNVMGVDTEDGTGSTPGGDAKPAARRALPSPWQTLALGLVVGIAFVGALGLVYWVGYRDGQEYGYWAAMADAGLVC